MNAFIWVSGLSLILGLSSFFVGVLPLSFNLSATHRTQLSTLGNGLLLGAALGVIIPEGIETLIHDNKQASYHQVGLSLITGFVFMLVVEQYGIHSPAKHPTSVKPQAVFQLSPGEAEALEYDLDNFGSPESSRENPARTTPPEPTIKSVLATPLTLGLVIHSLADGLALGASVVRGDEGKNLSVLVFLALIVHKSPTALALSTSLLSASLPRPEIRKHIAVFSLATPFGALLSFFLIGYLQTFAGNWTGVALLLSGGSFLYVATVIQPIGSHSHDIAEIPQERLGKVQRLLLLIGGILLPLLLGSLIGHGHGHGEEQVLVSPTSDML